MTRPSADQRRREYLEIGATIVAEFDDAEASSSPVEALANVKLSDVAERSGVTKGALYHVWSGQEEYRRELLERLTTQGHELGLHHLSSLFEHSDVGGDPRQFLRRTADLVFAGFKDDPGFFARFSYYLYAANPGVNELLGRSDDDLIEQIGPFVEEYLQSIGRRIREPFTVRLLLVAMIAYSQGLGMRHRTSPDMTDKPALDDPDGAGLYGFGIEGLIEHFSEPVPRADGHGGDRRTNGAW